MDLAPYVDTIRRELAVAAEAGGEEARALAERLTSPLESALRLALLDALSMAADEITRELAPGSVDVRLRGREPAFVVTPAPGTGAPAESHQPPAEPDIRPPDLDEGGGTSRITLRLPEHLKPRIDQAAAREGISVNAWLVRAVASALEPSRPRGPSPTSGRSHTGWVR
ncbi:toxin-antitoxin system HicB family antitoxin [Spirillospora sp. CA-294931]|uniref:toxin-antitoxin system HicB family antitoxin n=1 Tax=Spirillospora sp. CA-294931 TaxID=3240042 RepID=UPI003D8F90E5